MCRYGCVHEDGIVRHKQNIQIEEWIIFILDVKKTESTWTSYGEKSWAIIFFIDTSETNVRT